MSFKFETAVQKDLPRLVELLGILFESEAEFSADAEKQRVALHAILSDPAKGKIYVAREGREVVAMCSLLYTISTAEGGKAALFEDLVVAPEHRKRGIAAMLLKHVIEQARAEGVLRLTLLTDMQNERAQALYRRLGFVGSPMKPMRLKIKREPAAAPSRCLRPRRRPATRTRAARLLGADVEAQRRVGGDAGAERGAEHLRTQL